MSKDHGSVAIKEVEHSVVDALESYPKFMNAVSEGIGIGSMKFMSEILKSLDPLITFDSRLSLNPIEPAYHRDRPIVFLIIYDLDRRHPFFLRLLLSRYL